MNEQETRSRLIRPHITGAGWQDHQIREEFPYTLGRIHVSGQKWRRGEQKKVDFLLEYIPNTPLAVVEAKSEDAEPGKGNRLLGMQMLLMCRLFFLLMVINIFSTIRLVSLARLRHYLSLKISHRQSKCTPGIWSGRELMQN